MKPNFQNAKLNATLNLADPFPKESLQPSSCLDGSERNFEGIIFKFQPTANIAEIFIDTTTKDGNFIDIHYQLAKSSPVRIFEKDCEDFSGSLSRRRLTLNNRHMYRIEGKINVSCKKDGLNFSADVSGCLPETL